MTRKTDKLSFRANRGISLRLEPEKRELPRFARNDKTRHFYLKLSWSNTGNIDSKLVKPGDGGKVKGLRVGVSPCQIGGLFARPDSPQMLPFRRQNPNAAGARSVDVSLLIDLYSVGHACFLAR